MFARYVREGFSGILVMVILVAGTLAIEASKACVPLSLNCPNFIRYRHTKLEANQTQILPMTRYDVTGFGDLPVNARAYFLYSIQVVDVDKSILARKYCLFLQLCFIFLEMVERSEHSFTL